MRQSSSRLDTCLSVRLLQYSSRSPLRLLVQAKTGTLKTENERLKARLADEKWKNGELQSKLEAAKSKYCRTLLILQVYLDADILTISSEELAAARNGWVHEDEIYRRLEDLWQQHQEGLDDVPRVHQEEISKINADREDAIKDFNALTQSSAYAEKKLREEVATANSRMEQLQLAVKDATRKIIGKFTSFECLVFIHSFPFLTARQPLLK